MRESVNHDDRESTMRPCHRRLLLIIGLGLVCGPALARTSASSPTTWREVRDAAHAFLEQESFDEALAVVAEAAPSLRDRSFEISDLTMGILFAAGRADEAMDAWEEGLDEGYFYFIIPREATYAGVRDDDRFKANLARNNRLRQDALVGSVPEYRVVEPASYAPEGSYPLVIVIHGGNQSIVKAMERWDPAVFGDGMLVAYVQSSWRADTRSYRWNLYGVDIYSLPTARNEVLGLYREIVANHAVDTERVVLAGFSQGGNLALFMAADGVIPAKGFIAGCPATRTPVTPEAAGDAAARGVRGTIFVGADDWTAAAARTTVANFQEAGLSVNHIVMEDKGHELPDDFAGVLRDAMRHILQ
jgi:predicted esterase